MTNHQQQSIAAPAKPPSHSVRKILSVIAVVLLFVALTSVLMPSLRRAKWASRQALLEAEGEWKSRDAGYPTTEAPAAAGMHAGEPLTVLAHVKSGPADIDLHPRLSVGTDKPESIYEARFKASLSAQAVADHPGDSEIRLPLPPELISLADVTFTRNGDPDEKNLSVENHLLVWRGQLDARRPSDIHVTYTAFGRGLFVLNPPPGKIVETFEARLTAHDSNVRMLELSLQPQEDRREGGNTLYHWKYEKLIFARPIRLDVLGIAPEDRLGELSWLGPVSVLVFGLLVGLVGLAYRPEQLDKWMLLLIVGAFAGAYPLMYFTQEFLPLGGAVAVAGAVVLAIIIGRGVTLFGKGLGIVGTGLLAAAVMALTLWATIWPEMQGVVLTLLAIGSLVVAMVLLPRAQRNLAPHTPAPPPLPEETDRPSEDDRPG